MWPWRKRERRTTPCPYCPNPDRDFWAADRQNHTGACKYVAHGGEDAPCLCDNYGTWKFGP